MLRLYKLRGLFCCAAIAVAFLAMASVAGAQTTEPVAGITPVDIKPDASGVNSGDTSWILTSSALVLMMTGPGLALFYGGLVRRKNVLSVLMQCFILMAIVSVVWAVVGYSLAFDVGNPFIGGFRFAFLREVGFAPSEYGPTIPHTTWMIFQLMFAIITPGLICGAYAERMKFSAMVIFSVLWLLVVYCPLAHMVWGKGGLLNAWMPTPGGPNFGALDFAGGTVVHISSGVSALVCALVLGKRIGYGHVAMPPHSLVLAVVGAALLWVGWFGFNGGSALSSGGLASSAFVSTHFAAAAATLGWVLAEWIKNGKPTILGAISGAVAGLVVITPAAGFVTPMWGMVMGFIGGIFCMFTATVLKSALGYDDSLDAFGVHGCGGTLGALLTGVFAAEAINTKKGLLEGDSHQFMMQIVATVITWVIAAVGTLILLKITDVIVGIRVSAADEADGLDITQHGEAGYHLEDSTEATLIEDGHGATSAATSKKPAMA